MQIHTSIILKRSARPKIMATFASAFCRHPWSLRPSHQGAIAEFAESSSGSTTSRTRSNVATVTRGQMVGFKARREVKIPFRESNAFPAQEYVKQVERVVKLTFPDATRIQYLGNGTWRSRLRPITFFAVSATPVCDLRVFYEEATRALQLKSDKLVLEFLGLPPEFEDADLQFSLGGDLRVFPSSPSSSFEGSVSLGLEVDLPLPLSLMPEPILVPVGDGILDRILGAMEGNLLQGIVRDYKLWCRIQEMEKKRQESPSPNAATFRAAPTEAF